MCHLCFYQHRYLLYFDNIWPIYEYYVTIYLLFMLNEMLTHDKSFQLEKDSCINYFIIAK